MWPFRRAKKKYLYENTRRFLRIPASWAIKCEELEEVSETPSQQLAETKDVSAGGVSVVVQQMIPVGSRISVGILVPSFTRQIHAEGQVVRCLPARGGFELGIKFDHIDPQDQADLNKAVEETLTPRQKARQRKNAWRWVQ